jgi:hypothetical protein
MPASRGDELPSHEIRRYTKQPWNTEGHPIIPAGKKLFERALDRMMTGNLFFFEPDFDPVGLGDDAEFASLGRVFPKSIHCGGCSRGHGTVTRL